MAHGRADPQLDITQSGGQWHGRKGNLGGQVMLRSCLNYLLMWIKSLSRDPLSLISFLLAALTAGGATMMVLWMSALFGLVFALVGIPIIFGLLSLVPRIGGALSLGGNVGAAIILAVLLI